MSDKTYVEKVWVTEAGFKAVVLMCRSHHRCGYVGVDKNHPLFGQDYSTNLQCLVEISDGEPVGYRSPLVVLLHAGKSEHKSMDIVFDVHGGVTFSDYLEIKGNRFDPHLDPIGEEKWYIGFDCAHAGDAPVNVEPYDYVSPGDVVRSLDYVVEHCERLANQIKTKVIM